MQTLFVLLTLAFFLALLVGLVKPSLVMRWGGEEKQTRKQVLLYFGLGFLALLILTPTDDDSGQTQSIPEDLNYEIINEDVVPDARRSLDVRLSRKVPPEVLRSLAQKLKDSDSGSYDRTFIGYYLPGQTVNAGGWATSHFKPDLNVKILGVTAEKERELREGNDEVQGEVIGKWFYEGGFPSGSRIVLFRKDGNLQMKRTYEDGSSATTEMVEKQSSRGRRIEEKNNDTVDYWLINESGNLESRDDDGLIGTAERIQ